MHSVEAENAERIAREAQEKADEASLEMELHVAEHEAKIAAAAGRPLQQFGRQKGSTFVKCAQSHGKERSPTETTRGRRG